MSKKSQWAIIIALSGCFAIFSCWTSANLNPRFQHHAEEVYNQFAILKGLPHHVDGQEKVFPQFQGRVLFPLLLKGLTETHLMSDSQSFIFLRITTAFIGYLVFFIVCTQIEGMPVKYAALGAGMLAYALVFTFNHGWEHPTDFLDVAFFSAFVGLALQRRPIVFALAVFLATLNHQTAAFAGVIWFILWGLDERELKLKWQEVAFSSGLVIGSYAVSTAVKILLGGREQSVGYVIDGWLTIPQFIDFLRHPTPYGWPVLLVAMVVPVILWLWSNRAVVQGDVRRLIQASLCIVVLSSPIAFWSELRSVFLAPVLIAIFAATFAEARMQRKIVAVSQAYLDSVAPREA
jgi:hypothetical protein